MSFLAPLLIGSLAPTAAVGASLATTLALRVGASLILSTLAQKLTSSAATPTGNWGARGATVTDPLASRKIIYGEVRCGGVVRFRHISARHQQERAYLDLVIVFAGHEVEEIGNIYFDGRLAVAAGSSEGQGRYDGYVKCERALGSVDQVPFDELKRRLPEKWTDAHRMRGCAGIHLRLYYDPEKGASVWSGGEPQVTATIKGKKDILDPRTGTRSWSRNAALCVADYMSLPASMSINAQIGAVDGILTADLIESANICDETVARADGSTEVRYTCDGVVDTAASVQENIQAMLTAMGGECIPIGGAFSVRAAAYRAPSTTFNLDEAFADPILTPLAEISENFNGVRGKFFSPDNKWQPDDFPPLQNPAYLAQDRGQERWKDISLGFTTSVTMAQRLAKIELERQRHQKTVEWPGLLSCWRAAADDTVALTVPYWSFDAKAFEVRRVSLTMDGGSDDQAPALLPTFLLRETSPSITAWSVTEEASYVAAPSTDMPDPSEVTAPGVPVITEELYDTRDGGGVKARMVITWSASPTAYVVRHEVRVLKSGGDWEYLGPTSATMMTRDDTAPGAWTVQVRAVTDRNVVTDWHAASVTAELSGLSAPPSALATVSIQQAGGLAVLKWALPSDLDVRVGGHIVVRHSASAVPSWEGSLAMDEVAGSQTIAVVPLLPGSYLLRPRDSSGQLGPVSVLTTDGITATAFLPIGVLQEDDEFAGTHIGTYAVAGLLNIGSDGDLYASPDLYAEPNLYTVGGTVLSEASYEFATKFDFGAVTTVRLRRDVQMLSVSINSDLYSEPDLWTIADLYQSIPGVADVAIEIATTTDNPASPSAVWSGWQRLEATEVTARGVKARAVLSTQNPLITPVVSRLRIVAEGVA